MASAEPVFGYHLDFSGAFVAEKWTAGSEGTPLAEGDIVIAFVVVRTNDLGSYPTGPTLQVEGITTDGTDWHRDVDTAWHDPSVGNFFATGLWHKVWGAGDDPTGYQVLFDGYDIGGTGEAEMEMGMFVIHGAGGVLVFQGLSEERAYTGPFNGATFSRNFGDGQSSWGYTEEVGLILGETFGYHATAQWWWYEFPGVNLYGALEMGLDLPFLNFEPSALIDQSTAGLGDDSRPQNAFTFGIWDVLADVIRVAHNQRRTRRLSVS